MGKEKSSGEKWRFEQGMGKNLLKKPIVVRSTSVPTAIFCRQRVAVKLPTKGIIAPLLLGGNVCTTRINPIGSPARLD